MCGISGILNKNRTDSDQEFIDNSKRFHQFRGPDYFGEYTDDRCLLTHSRLAIIDLSADGRQPMFSSSKQSIIVFNGEIYNFEKLRKELNIQTNSDTAVVVEACEKWGIVRALQKLEGMFAFCYYHLPTGEYYLARDRFGQKPLYYAQLNDAFYFSSDIRVLHKSLRKQLSLNYCALGYYLSELSTPQPHSIWNEIEQIPPAHYFHLKRNGQVSKKRYWQLSTAKLELKEVEVLELLEEKLHQSIQKRQVSDLPVGCFLSGGVDSGLIVSFLASKSKQAIKTFSVGFNYANYDELDDARIIAEKYNTDHTEIKIDTDIKNDIEKILYEFGEPFADSSAVPTYYVSKETKKHVTVALSGDGGDELFAGYIDHALSYQAELYQQKISQPFLRKTSSAFTKISSRLSSKIQNKGELEFWLAIEAPYQLHRYMGFSPKKWLLAKGDETFIERYWRQIWEEATADSSTENLMRASLNTRLLNDYLVKVDRASMAHSLEVRSPFLDHELAEFALSIPIDLKMKNGQQKYLLKKLGQKYMYDDIFNRPKRGFEIPIKNWLQNELHEFAADHLTDLSKRELFKDFNGLSLLKEHQENKINHAHRIWALISLEIWNKKFND